MDVKQGEHWDGLAAGVRVGRASDYCGSRRIRIRPDRQHGQFQQPLHERACNCDRVRSGIFAVYLFALWERVDGGMGICNDATTYWRKLEHVRYLA